MGLKAMQVRGRMQEGMVADITLFDPETVTDNATYAKGTWPSTGIPHVIVNGIVVMGDSKPFKRFDTGQPIRFELQEKAGSNRSRLKTGPANSLSPQLMSTVECLAWSYTKL
jgi:N-acyl-D-aspartate/D-glutamate deacylase